MKKWLLLLLLAPGFWNVQAFAAERYTLEVDGLACPFCAYGVEKRLSAVDGVENVETDIKSGRVVVTVADGMPLSRAAAEKAVEEAGFTLRSFRKDGSIE